MPGFMNIQEFGFDSGGGPAPEIRKLRFVNTMFPVNVGVLYRSSDKVFTGVQAHFNSNLGSFFICPRTIREARWHQHYATECPACTAGERARWRVGVVAVLYPNDYENIAIDSYVPDVRSWIFGENTFGQLRTATNALLTQDLVVTCQSEEFQKLTISWDRRSRRNIAIRKKAMNRFDAIYEHIQTTLGHRLSLDRIRELYTNTQPALPVGEILSRATDYSRELRPQRVSKPPRAPLPPPPPEIVVVPHRRIRWE